MRYIYLVIPVAIGVMLIGGSSQRGVEAAVETTSIDIDSDGLADETVIHSSEHSRVVLVGSPESNKKAALAANRFAQQEAHEQLRSQTYQSRGLCDDIFTLTDQHYTSFGNGDVLTYFTSDHDHYDCWPPETLDLTAGYAFTEWGGTSPTWYSDEILMDQEWSYTGVSVSVSVPPGAGFSGSGSSASWSSGWQTCTGSCYRIYHHYSGIHAESVISILGFAESAAGTHRFGTQFASSFAEDSDGI